MFKGFISFEDFLTEFVMLGKVFLINKFDDFDLLFRFSLLLLIIIFSWVLIIFSLLLIKFSLLLLLILLFLLLILLLNFSKDFMLFSFILFSFCSIFSIFWGLFIDSKLLLIFILFNSSSFGLINSSL